MALTHDPSALFPGQQPSQTPSWFPLYLLCVLAATLFPFWVHCAPGELDLDPPTAFDVGQNVLLFWPLGFALHRHSGMACIAVAFLLSVLIESTQFWLLRSPSPWDVVANVLGAALAFRIADRVRPPSAPDRLIRLALLGAISLLILSLYAAPRRLGSGFEAWESMPLLIGNELSLDRPWSGSIDELAVYDRAGREPTPWTAQGPPVWQDSGPILWMRFQEPPTARIDGPGGVRPFEVLPPTESHARLRPDGLSVTGAVWALPPEVSEHVFERLKARGEIAVHAVVSPTSLSVVGPGRILSLSKDISERGFTLGQSGADLVFRVRTPVTSDNGTRPDVRTAFGPLTLSRHRVWASYDGFRSQIVVDGVCRGERILSAKRGIGTLGETLGVTLAAGCGLSALAASGVGRRRSRRWTRAVAGCGAAALFAAALWGMGAWEHLPFLGPWAAGLAAVAGALGVRVGLLLDDSNVPAEGEV